MGTLAEDAAAAVAAAQVVEADVSNQAPSFADEVLAAVQPVFEGAGWTPPAAPVAPADVAAAAEAA